MAELQVYPQGTPATNTMLVGTQMNVEQSDGTKKNLTRNFSVQQIVGILSVVFFSIFKSNTNHNAKKRLY